MQNNKVDDISKLAAVSGEGGLFVITAALKNGVMMESLDEKKTRIVAGAHSKVSVLSAALVAVLWDGD